MTALYTHNSMNEQRRRAETGGAEFTTTNFFRKKIDNERYTETHG